MHIVYESASIVGYCVCWVGSEWFACIVLLKVYVDFGEVVRSVHDANACTFITWFDTMNWFFLKLLSAVFSFIEGNFKC